LELEVSAGVSPAAWIRVIQRIIIVLSLSSLTIFLATARETPLTVKDVSLMLRSGFSVESILQDLKRRHFADKVDGAAEMTLLKAGATPSLMFALKSGNYSLSPQDAAKAKQDLEAQAKRHAALVEESRQLNTFYQEKVAQERAAEMLKFRGANITHDYLKESLVRLGNNGLVSADDDAIGKKKLIAYYFSAHWCAPCRKFTPKLVEYYNRVAPEHPEFEVVLYSFDKSATEMEEYMRETNMPWPAINYDKRQEKDELRAAAGNGIPALVLVDASGRLVSRSFDGEKYLGTQKVLDDLDAIFAGEPIDSIAAKR
jgi:nucleoredoxin